MSGIFFNHGAGPSGHWPGVDGRPLSHSGLLDLFSCSMKFAPGCEKSEVTPVERWPVVSSARRSDSNPEYPLGSLSLDRAAEGHSRVGV